MPSREVGVHSDCEAPTPATVTTAVLKSVSCAVKQVQVPCMDSTEASHAGEGGGLPAGRSVLVYLLSARSLTWSGAAAGDICESSFRLPLCGFLCFMHPSFLSLSYTIGVLFPALGVATQDSLRNGFLLVALRTEPWATRSFLQRGSWSRTPQEHTGRRRHQAIIGRSC